MQVSSNHTTDKLRQRLEAQMVRLLLEAGADPNLRSRFAAMTALIWAAYRGYTDMVKALLEGSADPNVKDRKGATALMWAAHHGQTRMVQTLLKAGADPAGQHVAGSAALVEVAEKGEAELAALLRNNADVNLIRAAERGDLEEVRALLETGADPNAQRTDETTPLIAAAAPLTHWGGVCFSWDSLEAEAAYWKARDESIENRKEMIRILLENGADLHPSGMDFFVADTIAHVLRKAGIDPDRYERLTV